MRRGRVASAVVVATALLASLIWSIAPVPSSAETARATLSASEQRVRWGEQQELASLPSMRLAPGETRLMEARLAARSDTVETMEQEVSIRCRTGGGGIVGEQVVASRNHEGSDAAVGDGYVTDAAGRPLMTLRVRQLFTAPPNAQETTTYTCAAWARAGTQTAAEGASLYAVRSVKDGAGRELAGTWIEVLDEHKAGLQWVDMMSSETAEGSCAPDDLYGRCAPRGCPPQDNDTGSPAKCQYIFPAKEPSAEPILETTIEKSTLSPNWSGNNRTVTVMAEFALTTCYRWERGGVSSSCNAAVVEDQAKLPYSVVTRVAYRLEVAEIDRAGRRDSCAVSGDSEPGRTLEPAQAEQVGTITDHAHHKKFALGPVTRRLSSNPDCTRLRLRVHVRATEGQPVKIEANRLSPTTGRVGRTLATGIVWMDAPQTPSGPPSPPPDADGDDVADSADNCPSTANPSQSDRDSDDAGDACDAVDDIANDSPSYPAILRLLESGVARGCDSSDEVLLFCPSANVTRKQMAVFLVRGMGEEGRMSESHRGTFSDVPPGIYSRYIEHLAHLGVSSGCGDGRFCPSARVTRAQMSVFLVRAMRDEANLPREHQNLFDDVPPSWFSRHAERLAQTGVTSGCAERRYCPRAFVSRAQMASFLVRAFRL